VAIRTPRLASWLYRGKVAVAMGTLEFPESLPDFQRIFLGEDACLDYLYDVRWPDGFVCPKCGTTERPSPRGSACSD
jgi:hypothetical protein